jgi:hypothetical protein
MRRGHEQVVLEGNVIDHGRRVELVRQKRRAVARIDKLHAEQEPAPAHIANDLCALQCGLELVA